MTKLSNEELKNILEGRIKKLENSILKEDKIVNEESVKILAKHLSLGNRNSSSCSKIFSNRT